MKKFLCLLFVFIALSGYCLAEENKLDDFVFRGEIRFGDSADKVKEAEGRGCGFIDPQKLMTEEMNLSGIPGSVLYYLFDDDALWEIEIIYSYRGKTPGADPEGYETIEDGLSKKYGPPDEDPDRVSVYVDGALNIYKIYYEPGERKLISSSRRFFEYADKRLIIEHMLCERNDEGMYMHVLTYQLVDKDDDAIVLNDL